MFLFFSIGLLQMCRGCLPILLQQNTPPDSHGMDCSGMRENLHGHWLSSLYVMEMRYWIGMNSLEACY
jgi:hypothetical protein